MVLAGRGTRAEVVRRGTGMPLLWLHGAFGLEWSMDLVDALSQRFDVIAPHLPGYGASDGLEGIDSFHDLSTWIDEVLDALDVETVAVAGHDFGAAAAAEYAALFRRRVSKLVLVAPIGVWVEEAPSPDVFGLTPGALTRTLFADARSESALRFNAADPDPAAAKAATLRRRQALIAAAKLLWPIPDKGLRRRLYRIAARTLLIAGNEDRLTGAAQLAVFEKSIAGVALACLAGGHMLPAEATADLARAMVDFVGA